MASKHAMTSKTRLVVNNFVRHDLKGTSWRQKVRHAVKNTWKVRYEECRNIKGMLWIASWRWKLSVLSDMSNTILVCPFFISSASWKAVELLIIPSCPLSIFPSVNIEEGRGQSQKRFSNFCIAELSVVHRCRPQSDVNFSLKSLISQKLSHNFFFSMM